MIDLKRLRGLAVTVTPGPWVSDDTMISTLDQGFMGREEDIVAEEVVRADDAAYIAALDPATVTALLDVVEAAREYCREDSEIDDVWENLRVAVAVFDGKGAK